MGLLPEARLKPSPAFNCVMLDLGLYILLQEKYRNAPAGKHMEKCSQIWLRGLCTLKQCQVMTQAISLWPLAGLQVFTDGQEKSTMILVPNKQVPNRNLKQYVWLKIDREQLQRNCIQDGSTWVFGPADDPSHQGAAESLIKAAKRAIHVAVRSQPFSVPKFLTVCSEAPNLLNECPIGAKSSIDSHINVLMSKSLLLGRARASNPLGWQPFSVINWYNLVQSVVDRLSCMLQNNQQCNANATLQVTTCAQVTWVLLRQKHIQRRILIGVGKRWLWQ